MTYALTYDEQERVKTIRFDYVAYASMSVDAEFTYDAGGRVTRVDYEYSKRRYYLEYTYDATGQLEKVVDAYYEEPELVTEREKLQHFIYRPDGTISAFDVNVTTVNELQYADGSMALGSRRVKDGFSPVLMPTYIEGLPPVTFVTYIDMFPDLFMYKYVYTKEVPGYGNTESASTIFPDFSYSCDENGQLEEFVYKENPNSYYWQYFRFEY